ncbi:hypothetical protein V6N11_024750 [Hibiscus sabdariffa]|uniref:Uncharacterized protein n=1 Tax=Hibiscus sabdariffa TaxID=183260 RepID=A0ABR2QNL1_9ROSI
MPIAGGAYTWSNQMSDNEVILEKLDRVLCPPNWNIAFPKAVVMLDITMGSDHALKRIVPRPSKAVGSRYHSLGTLIGLVASSGGLNSLCSDGVN